MHAKTTAITVEPAEVITRDQARQQLDAAGKTVAEFARENALPSAIVYKVLSGEKKGRNGNAHRAAVLLRLKAGTAFVQPVAKA